MSAAHRCFLVLALAGTLSAQNQGAGPGLQTGVLNSTTFDVSKAPFFNCATDIQQVSCQQLAGDPAGVYTTALSVGALCSTYGGNGLYLGLLLGKYDVQAGTFAASNLAAALNTPADNNFGLQLEPGQGRYAVFDRFDKSFNYLGVFAASRANAAAPFPAAVQVQGIAGLTHGYADPALGYVGGKLKLFYLATISGQTGIYADDYDPATAKVAGQPALVAVGARAGGTINSPTPLTGPDGDVEALWHADLLGNDNDLYYSNDLDPTTPALPVVDTPAWKNNGAVAGGRLLFGNGAVGWKQIGEVRGAWLLGDVEDIGGTLDIAAGAYSENGNKVQTHVLWSTGIGRAWKIFPPNWYGDFVLVITTFGELGIIFHDASQTGSMQLKVPNDPAYKGARIAIQGVAVEPARNLFTFTNHAELRVR
jgi:hypothetical protein